MAETLIITEGLNREALYREIIPQIAAVLEDENDLVANLANTAAMLKEAFGFFWVGFYRAEENTLILGPFQGPLACTRISFSRGVCGASATQQKTLLVPDVAQFPGHIACSSLSKSEVVVPLVVGGKTRLVLDVDSDQLDDFSQVDVSYLEQIVALLAKHFE